MSTDAINEHLNGTVIKVKSKVAISNKDEFK